MFSHIDGTCDEITSLVEPNTLGICSLCIIVVHSTGIASVYVLRHETRFDANAHTRYTNVFNQLFVVATKHEYLILCKSMCLLLFAVIQTIHTERDRNTDRNLYGQNKICHKSWLFTASTYPITTMYYIVCRQYCDGIKVKNASAERGKRGREQIQ